MINLDETYNSYKDRFFKHFVSLGDPKLPGKNLPAEMRYICGTTSIKYGDTTIDMAYYMVFLATDYYLYNNKESLDRLSDLLDSLERLDEKNIGLYKREDITGVELFSTCTSLLGKETFNGEIINDINLDSLCNDRSTYDPSTFAYATKRNIMSQDQFWHLLYGLKMVKTLIKDPLIINKVCKTTDKFLQYSLVKCNQIIKYPNGEKVPRGADMRVFAYGFAKAGESITDNKIKYTKYLHWWNKPLYKVAIWGAEILYRYLNDIFKLSLKEYSYRSLGCISNIWSKDSKYLPTLIKDFNERDWYPHFTLSHKIIYNSDISSFNKSKLEQLLLSIPKDGKIQRYKDSLIHYVWCVDNYLVNPEYSHYDEWQEGSYNGIDFMCLYNLYKIAYN